MNARRSNAVGVALSSGCGLLLVPLLIFWGVSWWWAVAISVPVAAILGVLRYLRPGLFDGYVGSAFAEYAAAQGRAGAPISGGHGASF